MGDATHSSMARQRVLVADDDGELLSTVVAALVIHTGAEVVTATTGSELLEALADQGPFDLLITDVSMPWMTGLEVAHAARDMGVNTPIIVMTGLAEALVHDRFGALGPATLLLLKPFDCDGLGAAVSALMPTMWPVLRVVG